MQKIVGTKILLTRGDTLKVKVTMTDQNGDVYEPENGDVVRFAMKQKYTDSECLVEKIIPNDTLLLQLEPADTKSLAFGSYVYDLQITYENGDVDTFIDRAIMELTEEVE